MSVTDQDREKAREVMRQANEANMWLVSEKDAMRNAIATALATEREETRAPFRELLDELNGWRHNALQYAKRFAPDMALGAIACARSAAYKRATDGIRHALQDQP